MSPVSGQHNGAEQAVPPGQPATQPDAGTMPHREPDGATGPYIGAADAPAGVSAIPGYEILGELGRGGTGVVYKARQIGLNRIVALKMILSGAHAAQAELDRFRTEALAIAQVRHPNIVQIYDIGDHDGLPYFSLEYCEGGSLAAQLRGEPQSPNDAAFTVEVLARAVHCAQGRQILHRDLKPANVLLTADGELKVTDFGLAKRLDADDHRTRTGVAMGTPSYMAPEQVNGSKDISPAVDIYALGAI